MANVTISGKELLGTLTSYLEHLEACRDFIEEFAVEGYMVYSLEIAKKKEYQYDFESLTRALAEYAASKGVADITPPRGTVSRLLESIDNLKDAEKLVDTLAMVIGHYDSKIPREMGMALDRLTDFDDSE